MELLSQLKMKSGTTECSNILIIRINIDTLTTALHFYKNLLRTDTPTNRQTDRPTLQLIELQSQLKIFERSTSQPGLFFSLFLQVAFLMRLSRFLPCLILVFGPMGQTNITCVSYYSGQFQQNVSALQKAFWKIYQFKIREKIQIIYKDGSILHNVDCLFSRFVSRFS